MALIPTDRQKGGYATAAAAMVSLTIAAGVSGFVAHASSEHRAARRDLERAKAQAALEGGHLIAVAILTVNGRSGRLKWSESVGGQSFNILAEPEADKVDVRTLMTNSAALTMSTPAKPDVVAARIQSGIAVGRPEPIADLDEDLAWRRCAPSILSYHGRAKDPSLAPASSPDTSGLRSHAGEVWRIAVTFEGWSDDRVVRITGNTTTPTSLISRRFGRALSDAEACRSLETTG